MNRKFLMLFLNLGVTLLTFAGEAQSPTANKDTPNYFNASDVTTASDYVSVTPKGESK